MHCPNCGAQLHTGAENCPNCGYETGVSVLSRQERDSFNGITIDEASKSGEHRQYSSDETDNGSRIKRISLSFGSTGWMGKLMVAAILALLVFFFLPLVMFILLAVGAVLIVSWLLQMLRR